VRLGERPARVRAGGGGQLIRFFPALLIAGCALPGLAFAQTAGAPVAATLATSIGPARIVCNASFCQMGSGARPKERFRVIVSDLPTNEIHRLRKCTGVAKPCIVTIEGTEQGGPMKIIANSIHWQDEPRRD
jgi:hypothetical protein